MTPRGSYTRETIEMFGLTWPPKKGWKRKLIGKPKTAKMIEIEKARNNQQGKVSEIDLQLEQLQKELISKVRFLFMKTDYPLNSRQVIVWTLRSETEKYYFANFILLKNNTFSKKFLYELF